MYAAYNVLGDTNLLCVFFRVCDFCTN